MNSWILAFAGMTKCVNHGAKRIKTIVTVIPANAGIQVSEFLEVPIINTRPMGAHQSTFNIIQKFRPPAKSESSQFGKVRKKIAGDVCPGKP